MSIRSWRLVFLFTGIFSSSQGLSWRSWHGECVNAISKSMQNDVGRVSNFMWKLKIAQNGVRSRIRESLGKDLLDTSYLIRQSKLFKFLFIKCYPSMEKEIAKYYDRNYFYSLRHRVKSIYSSRSSCCCKRIRPRGYKTFFMLTQLSIKFFLLIHVKMPTIVGILTCMSGKNNILGLSEP